MLIPVNQNIDEYKDDFYKGLTLRQSVISLITVAVGAAVYLALTMLLNLPQTLALYMTLPVVFPIAAYGFLKIHGMNIAEYMRKRGAVKERSAYSFIPQMLMYEADNGDMATENRIQDVDSTGSGSGISAASNTGSGASGSQRNEKKAKILYLETEESIRDADDAGKEAVRFT